jgi:hypothetical protein
MIKIQLIKLKFNQKLIHIIDLNSIKLKWQIDKKKMHKEK